VKKYNTIKVNQQILKLKKRMVSPTLAIQLYAFRSRVVAGKPRDAIV